jgi:acetyl esterase/lipase
MGDSAGANLSLALCRYLVELEHAGAGFGLPRTLLLNSVSIHHRAR